MIEIVRPPCRSVRKGVDEIAPGLAFGAISHNYRGSRKNEQEEWAQQNTTYTGILVR